MTINSFLKESNLKQFEAQIFLQKATGLGPSDFIAHPEKELSDEQCNLLNSFVEKRKSGLPVEYIVEEKNFYKNTFKVTQGVLIPQPDTETLVEEAVKYALSCNKESFIVLDLCTGTGCIGISFANEVAKHFKNFELTLSDISPIAIQCCTENAKKLLVEINYKIVQGDLFSSVKNESFDLILTNPPYIETSVIPTLENDVQHEPVLALDGGASGLEIITKIVGQSKNFLKPNGAMFMEIGYDQGKPVSDIFSLNNFRDVCVIKDLALHDRVVKGRI